MNIAVVGSRTFKNYNFLEETLDKLILERKFDNITIISGGARGTDTLAEYYAQNRKYPTIIHIADWNNLGKQAGYLRNEKIVDDADIIIAFHQNNSKGTKHTIDLAKNRGIEVIILRV